VQNEPDAERIPSAPEVAKESAQGSHATPESPNPSAWSDIWARIKEHKVAQWTLAYAAFAYTALHAVQMAREAFEWPTAVSRVTLLVLLLGTPIAATLAWYHGHRSRRRISATELSILTVLLVIAGTLLWVYGSRRGAESVPINRTATAPATSQSFAPPPHSVAVLPFVDMSEKKDQEYFGDGMAEEIIDLLTKVPGLYVPARTSSFYFKGKPTKVDDIARELRVAHILEGSIRKSGNQIRVTAQLVRSENGYHLWSETYDRDLRDVFKVQDEIANAVVQALQIGLMGGPLTRPKGGTQNLEAYQLYLRAVSAQLQPAAPSQVAVRKFLDQAIALDPKFGLAWSEIAWSTLVSADNGDLDSKEGYERARQLAQHALQLSPELADAHVVLQYVHLTYDWDWGASEREGQLALSADPNNSTALMVSGLVSSTLGRWDDAVRRLRLAVVRDPLDTYVNFNLGTAFYLAGRFADAEGQYRRVIALAPGFGWAYPYLGKTLLAEGKPEAALAVVQQAKQETDRMAMLSIALQAAGRTAEADDALSALLTKFANTDGYWVAMTYAYRGDRDHALQWLERSYAQKNIYLREILGEPLLKNLANDPRYKAFLRKMNLPE